ncbi:MAG: DciA family protein [Gaiellaceae bacterium]
MAPLVEVWPAAVGDVIARNAWPARIARDGTLHVNTTDSIWAFELTSRAEEIRSRLGARPPARLAFTPGPIPEPAEDASGSLPQPPEQPSEEHRAAAEALTRDIRDDGLREVVAKTVAFSLSRASNSRPFW